MEISYKKLSELKPYERNARKNDKAVDAVVRSISQFGFRVPILIEKNGTIVAGHTRYKACKKLHKCEVPCIVVDGLTDEQIRAFRLADNKVAEIADWDFQLLDDELDSILDIDMSEFGFEFEVYEDNFDENSTETKENERVRTINTYNLNLFNPERTEGKWGMPIIEGEEHIPKNLIGFNYVKSTNNFDTGVHFFIDDYQFERLWNTPEKYLDLLQRFDCVLTPDFSLYLNMPLAMQIWNVYRSRLLGQYWQDNGIIVIPTVSWGDAATFDFCFDGLPEKSILAVSTVGVLKESNSMRIFKDGIHELIQRKSPKTLIVYGRPMIDYDFESMDIVQFSNSVTDRLEGYGRK